MPTFESLTTFADTLGKLGKELSDDEKRKITKRMAEAGQKIAVAAASADLGGNPEFSGWKHRSLADMKIRPGRDNTHWLFPTKKSGGPWKVAEQGRNQGDARGRGGTQVFFGPGVDRKDGSTFRTKTGKVLVRRTKRKRWNGYTKGKGTATKATGQMNAKLPDLAEREVLRAIGKRFDVT